MCHHHPDPNNSHNDIAYCGRCFLDNKGFIISTPHIKVERRTKTRKVDYKRKKKLKIFLVLAGFLIQPKPCVIPCILALAFCHF